MSLTVTSHYRYQMTSTNPASIVRQFIVKSSDFSPYVITYPSISRDVLDVIGGNVTVELQNADQIISPILNDRTWFGGIGVVNFGFATNTGSYDTQQVFGGELIGVNFRETRASVIFQDKLLALKKRRVGTKDAPVSWTNTTVNPADLAWWAVVSYGGLSGLKSTNNPDIDYTSWSEWFDVFDGDSIVVHAYFTGENIVDIISTIQDVTDSSIYAEGDNKLYFERWSGVASDTLTITDSVIKQINMSISGTELVNRATVLMSYNANVNTWAGRVTYANSTSINSHGIFEKIFDNETIWFCNSAGAKNLAQRIIGRRAAPNVTFEIETTLGFLDAQLGDEVEITSQIYSLDARTVSLRGYTLNTDRGMVTLRADEGMGQGSGRLHGFILDDVTWGLLDQDYNALY